jgi:hypothetical protein
MSDGIQRRFISASFRWLLLLFALGVELTSSQDAQAQGGFRITPVVAQFTSLTPNNGGTTEESTGIDRVLLYKLAGVAGGTLIVFFLSWFALYPAILRRGNIWPVTLYGRCTCFAWVSSWIIALAILWYELPLAPGGTFWNEHGLRLAFVAAAILIGGACVFIWRSDTQASRK